MLKNGVLDYSCVFFLLDEKAEGGGKSQQSSLSPNDFRNQKEQGMC